MIIFILYKYHIKQKTPTYSDGGLISIEG
jgi:hypothetical protein